MADAKAYKIEKDAEARKKAADADAEAVTKKAQADANAKKMEADGTEAIEMVPVKVDQKRVEIDRDRVETVVKPELEARQQFGKVAQDFEIQKLAVEAEKVVRVESARASVQLFSKLEANLYGTPQDATAILNAALKGQGAASMIEGFVQHAGPDTKAALKKVGDVAGSVGEGIASRLASDNNVDSDGDTEPPVVTVPRPGGLPSKPKDDSSDTPVS
jgi:nucleoside diphosphate kinase